MAVKTSPKPNVLVVDDGTTYSEVIANNMPEVNLVDPVGYGEANRIADGPSTMKFLAHRRNEVDVVLLDMHFDIPDEQLFELDKKIDKNAAGLSKMFKHIHQQYHDGRTTAISEDELVSLVAEFMPQILYCEYPGKSEPIQKE